MDKYATNVIKQWPWSLSIEWLNDRGMVELGRNLVAEIRPLVYDSLCSALKITVYTREGVSKDTAFSFADYLCDVPRCDNRTDWDGAFHLWKCNSSECDWYIKVPAHVKPLLRGIERWLEYQHLLSDR